MVVPFAWTRQSHGGAIRMATDKPAPRPRRTAILIAMPRDRVQMLGDAYRSRRLPSRSNLGAILPLHDVRYHASAGEPDGSIAAAENIPLRTSGKTPAGGARRDRTDDLLLAKQALSQLSYGPSGGQRTEIGAQKTVPSSVVRILSSDDGGPGKI
jgi:hypothetical protein